MKHTIMICGYGPGISRAAARRLGTIEHPDTLVARNAQHLAAAFKELSRVSIQVHTLAPGGVYTGEVAENGFVEGTSGGTSKSGTVAPTDIAEQSWKLHTTRQLPSVIFGGAVPVTEVAHYV